MKVDNDISSVSCGVLNSSPCCYDAANKIKKQKFRIEDSHLYEKYCNENKNFMPQFYNIYGVRLSKMMDRLRKKVLNKWGADVPVNKLMDLQSIRGQRCVIIGTLFKYQELKPSILREISQETNLIPQPSRKNFVSKSDKLILEDDSQRITLIGDIDINSTVTGVICAVIGKEDNDGKFVVEDCCWAGCDTVSCYTVNPSLSQKLIVFVSGLDLANNASLLHVQLLVDWLNGWLGDPQDQEFAAKIIRVIITGNCVRATKEAKQRKFSKIVNTSGATDRFCGVKLLDDVLHDLVQYVDVDIMAGEFDPTNHSLPQQPLHYCMLPKASAYQSLHRVPNPYCCEIEGCRILGTSGQPIDDIIRFSTQTDPISVLQQTLEWGHLAPTAPDTLDCFPYVDDDPFIIDCQPDIYFAGNQPSFQTKLYEDNSRGCDSVHKVRLICVPDFSKTGTCGIINLSTLECYPMNFKVDLPPANSTEEIMDTR